LDAAVFAAKAAHHLGELNAIYGFQDGNGRATRLHLKQLGPGIISTSNGCQRRRLPAQKWNSASKVSFETGDSRPLAAITRGLGHRALPEPERMPATLFAGGRLVYA
jgi:fido (protein-threonine AMPylation protein)